MLESLHLLKLREEIWPKLLKHFEDLLAENSERCSVHATLGLGRNW
jgi:hypothetical protein